MIICDNQDCKKEFDLNILKTDLGDGIAQLFLKCPHCNREYNISKTNSEIENLQKK